MRFRYYLPLLLGLLLFPAPASASITYAPVVIPPSPPATVEQIPMRRALWAFNEAVQEEQCEKAGCSGIRTSCEMRRRYVMVCLNFQQFPDQRYMNEWRGHGKSPDAIQFEWLNGFYERRNAD